MAESDMIIIAYFFFLHLGGYTASKSQSTLLRLKDTVFSCRCRIFAATATASDLQATNFVMLTFTTQNNGIRRGEGGVSTQGFSIPSLFPQGGPCPAGAPSESPWVNPLQSTIPRHDSDREVGKDNLHHDIKDPQDRRRFLRNKTRI